MSYNSKFPDEYDEYGEYSPDRNTQGDIRFDDDVIDLFNFDQARKRRQQKLREAQAEQSRREDAAENDGYADSPEAENVRRAVTERSRKMQSGRYDRRLNDRYDGGEYDSYDDEYDRHDHREYDRGDDIAYGELLESRFGEPSPRRRSRQDITFSEHPVRKAEERRNRPAAKKKRSGIIRRTVRNKIITACVAVACVLLAAVIALFGVANSALGGMNVISLERAWDDAAAPAVQGTALAEKSGITNILLLGIDDEGGAGCRSDTIIIVSVNTRSNTIKMSSILRDCYVEVPGRGKTKINHAHAFGGPELTVRTVESNFRVKIDEVAAVSMESLSLIVGYIGGVTLYITQAEAEQINMCCGGNLTEGVQWLNSPEAVYFSRIRKIDSDFARTGRQRRLLSAMIAACKEKSPTELLELAENIAPYITTTMTPSDIVWLGLRALPAISKELEQITIPAEGTYSFKSANGMSIISLDLAANVEQLHNFIFQ